LITHWGMSGPAVLKLSAWGARELEQRGYSFAIQVNWVGLPNGEEVSAIMETAASDSHKKKLVNACPFDLPKNFWQYLLEKSGLDAHSPWMELGKKGRNKLVNTLLNDTYTVRGKTTFKEEFVTCGGVTLGEVDFKTMQSRVVPGLYFAGEVLDVDGITGGFNFQAAWTTGFVAGQLNS
ncbi:MAG: aminoacetone oxidase family FAD-binding enzyme, partial [Flavobacteriales bacterium]|nr:aminoacetone oxidase family FAD-binding enzyme [Flavobacteriales bacterium]